jgi:hypothetical protein
MAFTFYVLTELMGLACSSGTGWISRNYEFGLGGTGQRARYIELELGFIAR